MSYILVLLVYVGGFSTKESNAVTTVEFKSEKACEEAREKVNSISSGMKTISSICLKNY